jgi:hypothetical protein
MLGIGCWAGSREEAEPPVAGGTREIAGELFNVVRHSPTYRLQSVLLWLSTIRYWLTGRLVMSGGNRTYRLC